MCLKKWWRVTPIGDKRLKKHCGDKHHVSKTNWRGDAWKKNNDSCPALANSECPVSCDNLVKLVNRKSSVNKSTNSGFDAHKSYRRAKIIQISHNFSPHPPSCINVVWATFFQLGREGKQWNVADTTDSSSSQQAALTPYRPALPQPGPGLTFSMRVPEITSKGCG